MLAGAADFMIGRAEGIRKTAGDVLFMKSNTPHGFRNTGDTLLRTYGVHASPVRITHRDAQQDDAPPRNIPEIP